MSTSNVTGTVTNNQTHADLESSKNTASRMMHRYVLGWVGLLVAMVATFPIAMVRVSQNAKFAGQAVNSQTCEAQQPSQRTVVSWLETCRHLQKPAIAKH